MEKEWAEKVKETRRISGSDYWNKRALDYADYIRTSDYEHGRKIKEVFEREGILKEDLEILDIAAGPGSVTIPFAESVRKATAVEPAEGMCKRLVENSLELGLENIEIMNMMWEEVDDAELEDRFDLVVCSNALWQFPDIWGQLARMNRVSRGYCCIAIGVGSDETFSEMYRKLKLDDGDIDHFIGVYNTLYERDVLANVRMIETVMRRSVNSGISMWELLLSKYREPTEDDKEIIRDHVADNSEDGVYRKEGNMAVIWWKS
ncbi:MAG: class I SAM-dependent methyltransferase [Candidatus Thermoplasmatota archaeon]|nr:class I SAM-dependent methyltransferase [Candidatus Thermoplasmatota archaeon]